MKRSTRSCLAVPFFFAVLSIAVIAVIAFWPMPKGEIYFKYVEIEIPEAKALFGRGLNSSGIVVGDYTNPRSKVLNRSGFVWSVAQGLQREISFSGFPLVSVYGISEDGLLHGNAVNGISEDALWHGIAANGESRPFIQTLAGENILSPTGTSLDGEVIHLNKNQEAIIQCGEAYPGLGLRGFQSPREWFYWKPGLEAARIDIPSISGEEVKVLDFNDDGVLLYARGNEVRQYYTWSQTRGHAPVDVELTTPGMELLRFMGSEGYYGLAPARLYWRKLMKYTPSTGWTEIGVVPGFDEDYFESAGSAFDLSGRWVLRTAGDLTTTFFFSKPVWSVIDWWDLDVNKMITCDLRYSSPRGELYLNSHTTGLDNWNYVDAISMTETGSILVRQEWHPDGCKSGVLVPTDAYREKFLP